MSKQKKTIKQGNTTIIIYSEIINMTDQEKSQWFETEMAAGNEVLKDINQKALDCYFSIGGEGNGS